MSLPDSDLELVSAFHDGELEPGEARRFRARLESEPELRAALEEIRETSSALRRLRPKTGLPRTVEAGARRPWHALAASLAAAAILAAVLFQGLAPGEPRTPLDWHEAFAAKRYETGDGAGPVPVSKWIGLQPDLSAANLRLVDMAGDAERSLYFHYAGVNNCRLTFGAHAVAPEPARPRDGLLAEAWSDGEMHYTLIAVRMDRNRFDAVARLLRERTRIEQASDGTLAAARQATRDAVPCA